MGTTVLTLQPNETSGVDTFISQAAPTFNYGVTTSIEVGTDGGVDRKGLLQFDLSSIPADSRIVSAVLSLYCFAEDFSSSYVLHARRGLVQWFEGSTNGAAPGAGVNGSTWNHKNANGSVAWSAAGGVSGTDYAASDSASVTITTLNTWYSLIVTTDVQDWYTAAASNFGWFLTMTSGSESRKFFYSSNFATASLRPKLVITYEPISDIHASADGTSTVTGTLTAPDRYSTMILQPHGAAGIDSRIRESSPTANSGGQTIFSVGWDSVANKRRRGLIKFDLSTLPPNAIITRAAVVLRLTDVTTQNPASSPVGIHRSLVEWFEGNQVDAAPGAGVDGSTWNLRNANGSVAWAGGVGGQAGTEWLSDASDTETVLATPALYEWIVTQDVQDFLDGTYPNYGWWLIGLESGAASTVKSFDSSDGAVNGNHPYLIVEYSDPDVLLAGAAAGTATATAAIHARGYMHGSAAGTSTVEGKMTNVAIGGAAAGVATVGGALTAIGRMHGSATGSSTTTGRLMGRAKLRATVAGLSTAEASGGFVGQMRGLAAGQAIVTGTLWGKANAVIPPRVRHAVPLLYFTDGENRCDLMNRQTGYLVCKWKPALGQYKGGGQWADSAMANGRRLVMRRFANVIEVMTFSATGKDADELAAHTNELLRWLEAAADYWANRRATKPVYLVSRAAHEQNSRYAIVHMASIPELENIYDQPFFTNPTRAPGRAAFDEITLRIERGPWLDQPPGLSSCVPLSSVRSWTVAGWEAGS